MNTRIISEQVLDYAISIVINSVPGIAEADAQTRETYKNMSKGMLSSGIKSTHHEAVVGLNSVRSFSKRMFRVNAKRRLSDSIRTKAGLKTSN